MGGCMAKSTMAGWVLGALLATGAAAAPPPPHGRLVEQQRVEHLDGLAREPSLAVTPTGDLYVAGYGGSREGKPDLEPAIWRSAAGGAQWERLKVDAQAQGVIGQSDTSLALARDGTLYFASLYYDREPRDSKAWKGDQFSVGASHDGGRTWKWTNLSKNPRDDRGWVAVAPDGVAHVVWNDGDHVFHAMSADGGTTWSTPVSIHAGGGSSHLAIGPNGHIAVRVSPIGASGFDYKEHADLLLVSVDGGLSWKERQVPGVRQWAATDGAVPRWVEPLAWDAKGALYLLWSQADGLHLGRSRDEGLTWDAWILAPSEGDDLMYYPYLIARGDGELAATWYRGGGTAVTWQAATFRVDKTIHGLSLSEPVLADAWDAPAQPSFPRVRSAAGEYTGLAWAPGGGIGVVTPIQDKEANRFGFTYRRLAAAKARQ